MQPRSASIGFMLLSALLAPLAVTVTASAIPADTLARRAFESECDALYASNQYKFIRSLNFTYDPSVTNNDSPWFGIAATFYSTRTNGSDPEVNCVSPRQPGLEINQWWDCRNNAHLQFGVQGNPNTNDILTVVLKYYDFLPDAHGVCTSRFFARVRPSNGTFTSSSQCDDETGVCTNQSVQWASSTLHDSVITYALDPVNEWFYDRPQGPPDSPPTYAALCADATTDVQQGCV